MKIKLLLLAPALASCFALSAQSGKKALGNSTGAAVTEEKKYQNRGCGTQVPGEQWDKWFNEKVEEFVKHQQQNKGQMPVYTIPVVVHVIHPNQAVGVGHNLSAAQIQDQINILNADFAGTGLNNTNIPSVFASLKANCDIQFCLAQKNPSGATLTEPGIDRQNATTNGWTSGPYTTTYIDGTIKPATIWDPTRYLNMWVCNLGSSLLGYATFPAGSGLTGIPGSLGTATTDGVVMLSNSFGSIGTAASNAPYHKGRTTTHEVGHWLGLRHIWGDASCGNDFCADTPTQQADNNGTCPTFPKVSCGNGPNGELFMNFMDYTNDVCMYMFSNDQRTRMQTCMANGTFRSQLSTSAATLCNIPASAPTASFSIPTSGCTNTAVAVNNLSSGNPIPTYAWSSNPSAGVTFNPNNTATNPSINFTTPGSYTITVAATNSLGTSNNSKTIVITNCSVSPTCNDTISHFIATDTLFAFRAGADVSTSGCSPNAGYIMGNNCYGDLEKADYFTNADYSAISGAQINGVIVLFYKDGTRGTGGNSASTVGMRIYNSTSTTFTGAPSGIIPNASIGFTSTTLGTILAAPSVSNVNYCGNPSLAFANPIIKPFRFNFAAPVTAPTSGGFFASVVLPTGATDTAVVFNSGNSNGLNRAYEKWSGVPAAQSWYQVRTAWGNTRNYNAAILPIMSCGTPSGIKATEFNSGVMLYPNPTNGELSLITTFASNQNVEVSIHNVMGQLMGSSQFQNVTNNVFNLNLQNYTNGVYFVTIDNGSEKVVKRIVLNK